MLRSAVCAFCALIFLLSLASLSGNTTTHVSEVQKQEKTNVDLTRAESISDLAEMVKELYGTLIKEAARQYRIPEKDVLTLILLESRGRYDAVSKEKAMGLMGLMPRTAKAMGVKNPYDPRDNIYGGTRYLREQFEKFKNLEKALIAYNLGPGKLYDLLEFKEGFSPREMSYVKKFKKIKQEIS